MHLAFAKIMRDPFMARAIELSIENVRSGRGGPFAAVVVKDGTIIAEAANCVTADAAKAGFDDSFIYEEIGRPHASRKIPMVGMMREEALAAFRAWEENPGKIGY